MRWFFLLSVLGAVFAFDACQRQNPEVLEVMHGAGHHGEEHQGEGDVHHGEDAAGHGEGHGTQEAAVAAETSAELKAGTEYH